MLPREVHEQQKNALMKATVSVIAGEGMEGLTIRRVGSLCGIKEIYIYRYFENRDDMVAKTFTFADKRLHQKAIDALPLLKDGNFDFETGLKLLLKAYFDFAVSYPDWLKFYVRYYYSEIFRKNSYNEHIKRYADLVDMLTVGYRSHSEAEDLLHCLTEALLSYALRQVMYPCDEKRNTDGIFGLIVATVEGLKRLGEK